MYKNTLPPLLVMALSACVASTTPDLDAPAPGASEPPATSGNSSTPNNDITSSSAISSSESNSSESSSSEVLSSEAASSSTPAEPPADNNDGMNLLGSDGTFDKGKQNFNTFFHEEAQPSTATWQDEAAINIGGLSSMIWHGQLQHAVQVTENTQYTVCFDAIADAERGIEFSIDGDQDSNFAPRNAVAIGAEAAAVASTITTDWQTFRYTFYANATDASARFIVSMGLSDANIRFDNIGMYEGESCGNPANVPERPDTSLPVPGDPSLNRDNCPAPPPAEIGKTAPNADVLGLSSNELKELFVEQTPFAASKWTIPWNFYQPDEAINNTTGEQFPLVVVLHGGYGSEGLDGNVTRDVLRYAAGLDSSGLLMGNVANFPAYIVAPHCRMSVAGPVTVDGQTVEQPACAFTTNEWASDGGANFDVQAEPSLAGGAMFELVEHIIATFDVDPSRVYITGNSMGGGGTWEAIVRRPDLFAAALPVSGHTPDPKFFERVADSKMPIWAFAGSNDGNNPVADTRNAISQIADQGGCAWLTEYSNAGHDDTLWAGPYQEPGFWPWVFDQKLPEQTGDNNSVKADYEAPRTNTKPTIDGTVESAWDNAPWAAIDKPWTFEDLVAPTSASDFSGRYKAMWDAEKLYVLVEITDDSVIDWTAEPTDTYWQDDTVEIFIDEDRSGGLHRNHSSTPDANDANAFAYHLSTLGDNLDNFNRERTIFGDDHVRYRRVELSPTQSVWEMEITLWGDDYTLEGNHIPVTLTEGKLMGFTMSYIDTDGNNGRKREHFIGSVDTPGHQNNEGFINADALGSLRLVP